MKNTKKLCIALSVAACLCAGVAVGAQVSAPIASADTETITYESNEVKMAAGASIRMDADSHGIRFSTFIGNNVDLTETYGAGYKLGTLFIPASAINSVEDLTDTATFNGVSPARVEVDGATATFSTSDLYPNGKLFNAVLDLSQTSVPASTYLNSDIVARSYVKKADGSVVYLGSETRSPAYVAAKVVTNPDDPDKENQTLINYVKEITVEETLFNAAEGGEVTLPAANIADVAVEYTASAGAVEGGVYTAAEGVNTVTATLFKGTPAEKEVQISVAALENGQYTFQNKYYTPEGTFDYTAYGVESVKLGDTLLVEGTDYTYEENTLKVNKAAVVENEATELTVVSATAGDATVGVKSYLSDFTSFNAGQPSLEILGDLNNNAEEITADTEAGTVNFKVADKTKRFYVNLNEDYLSALFALPTLANLYFSVEFSNVTTGKVLGYSSVAVADPDEMQAQYTSYSAKKSVGINRATFNKLKECGKLSQFGAWIDPTNLTDNSSVKWHSVDAIAVDDATSGNHLYADVPLIQQRGLSYPYPALINSTGLTGNKWATTTKDGDHAVVPAANVNASIRNGEGFDVTPTGWDRDRVYLYTKAMLDENQYVTEGQGTTYTYPFALPAGDTIYRVSLNGKQITTYDENGNITVNTADLEYGHNALEINVEHNYEAGTTDKIFATTCHTYYRSLCLVTEKEWSNAITFEDGMSPFVSVIGAAGSGVVNGTEIDATYETRKYQDTTNDSALVANKKVLKLMPNATLYVSSAYIKARAAKLGGATVADWNDLACLSARGYKGANTNSRNAFTTVEGGVSSNRYFSFASFATVARCATSFVTKSQYESLTTTNATYVSVTVSSGTTSAVYIDDICANLSVGSNQETISGDTAWFATNPNITDTSSLSGTAATEGDYVLLV